jgi:hypothetical protein
MDKFSRVMLAIAFVVGIAVWLTSCSEINPISSSEANQTTTNLIQIKNVGDIHTEVLQKFYIDGYEAVCGKKAPKFDNTVQVWDVLEDVYESANPGWDFPDNIDIANKMIKDAFIKYPECYELIAVTNHCLERNDNTEQFLNEIDMIDFEWDQDILRSSYELQQMGLPMLGLGEAAIVVAADAAGMAITGPVGACVFSATLPGIDIISWFTSTYF